ncbi:VOC family protein [Dinghuibacter silviterrae]|uniref:Putative 3-demethylubiquinone-9 3-methyltransferase (Glyoxalase superfamily) n=1 Tax=Dinghuibacter silviterrae TaxID=1539049 RepID=A0A4R8DFZ4_9BACT|nr:VOC family protein [Dinghuibacter silviterrae]TDW96164.1 putative 3-demethylubiquinone-9 3-methyltransferase (glyoxalase superfamily) [Dinghuibacter silviterrae]
MKHVTTFLWFNDAALDAARFYTSIIKNSRILGVANNHDGDKPMVVHFELDGQQFMALNGGPLFPFTEAISLYVNCETQEEIDYYWDKLSEGGAHQQCGWLKDKWGLSWQVVPAALTKLLEGGDPAKAGRVMNVVMRSVKLNVRELEEA